MNQSGNFSATSSRDVKHPPSGPTKAAHAAGLSRMSSGKEIDSKIAEDVSYALLARGQSVQNVGALAATPVSSLGDLVKLDSETIQISLKMKALLLYGDCRRQTSRPKKGFSDEVFPNLEKSKTVFGPRCAHQVL